MRKIIVFLITLIILSGGLFSGCTEDKVPTNHNNSDNNDALHIIGVWSNLTTSINLSGVNRSTLRAYRFTDTMLYNYSVYYMVGISGNTSGYSTHHVGTYEIREGNLTLIDPTKSPPPHLYLTYSFNNNYTTLTLTDKSGSSIYVKN